MPDQNENHPIATRPQSAIDLIKQSQVTARELARQQLVQHISKVGGVLKKALTIIDSDDMNVIPNDLFVKYYLPLFSGEMQEMDIPYKDEKIAKLIELWIRLAGNPYRPVAIINEQNERIAIVPPLHDRNILPMSFDRPDRQTMDSMMTEATNISRAFPDQAHQYLIGSLRKRFVDRFQDGANSPLKQQWIDLLTLYGKSPTNGVTLAGQATKSSGAVEDIDYNDIDI